MFSPLDGDARRAQRPIAPRRLPRTVGASFERAGSTHVVASETLTRSMAARLFLLCALALLCAFARPAPIAGPHETRAALAVSCVESIAAAASVGPASRESALRDERPSLTAVSTGATSVARRPRPVCVPLVARAATPLRIAGDPPPPRPAPRAFPATGPPRAA